MPTWFWLLAYVVGFGLLQVAMYRHFTPDDPRPDTTPATRAQPATGRVDHPTEDGAVLCPNCGESNEEAANFQFCRYCVGPLE